MAKSARNKRNRNRKVASKSSRDGNSSRSGKPNAAMVFSRKNYLLMLLGVILVVFGYSIMRMENEVDGLISLYVAPLIILGGYLEIIYAILWRKKETYEPATADAAPATEAT